MDIPGFETVQELVRDGPYTLFRARRSRDRRPVIIKASSRVPPRSGEEHGLEREFEQLRILAIPGVPQVLDLARTPAGVSLVFDDRGLTPLRRVLDDGVLPLGPFFRILTRLCEILRDLHRRDLIHGNVTPDTTFANPSTGEVQLWGYAPASRLAPAAASALAYVSPEQTGRMNRAVDYRSDFYSLGVMAYELILGAPPFRHADPLELIHAHIARTPPAPSAQDPTIPVQVSRIVLKLLAKTPEDRYQSAAGIRDDLEHCAREWSDTGSIAVRDLARHDQSDRFVIPQRLYGRDREIEVLQRAFDRTCQGETSMLLVAGYSGVGKTRLIHELHASIARRRGYLIAGKFDQIARNVPYGAVIQAFRGLVRQLLAESEERVTAWRSQISEALGANGGVLAEVVPEIELIIGPQETPPPLGPTEAQNRFQYVFQRFVGALAQADRPLVVVLDDLQWADAATLELLHALMTSSAIRHLLVIGAYRDNEVDAAHLLTWALDRLQAEGARLESVALTSLSLGDLVQFLRDTLHGDEADVEPLARLILQKTDGNPFFVIQFLNTLQQDGRFEFDPSRGRWLFEMPAIAAAQMTDNVVELMTRKIRQLSFRGQHALMLAACIGSPFAHATFRTVSGESSQDAEAGLHEALDVGLILPVARSYDLPTADGGDFYAFLHDRVQQTAYSLIHERRRAPLHLQIGRLLLAECGGAIPDDRVFEIVNHLNIGSTLLVDEVERLAVARLNLAAGRRAKASAAYRAASAYAEQGVALARDEHWTTDHELMLALHLEAAECQYLSGQFEAAEHYFRILLERAANRLELAEVHSLRIVLCENLSRFADAVAVGREALALFGISFPAEASGKQAALDADVMAIESLLGGRPIGALADVAATEDRDVRMMLRILTALWAPSYLSGDQLLTRLISATMVRLSLLHGNTEDSAYGYVTHAITIGPIRGDYESAYEWGELALRVNERFNDAKRRAKIHQQFHAHVQLWRRPFETCIPHARQACQSGLDSGDFTYAGYGAFTESWPALLCTRDLEQFIREYTPTVSLLERIRMPGLAVGMRVILSWVRALQGRTATPLSISHAEFDETAFLEAHADNPFLMNFYHAARLHLSVLFQNVEDGVAAASRAQAFPQSGTIWPIVIDFWSALAHAADAGRGTAADHAACAARLAATEASLATLASNCPENFRCFALLVASERCRIEGRPAEALARCEDAVRYAQQTGSVQHEALAHELSARLWLHQGLDALASASLREARRTYAEWGATAKVRDLERRYARHMTDTLASPITALDGDASTEHAETTSLDLVTVLKVARAIAGEIELEDLLRTLIRLAIENAGAQRGAFLQDRGGELTIEVEADVNAETLTVRRSRPLDQTDDLAGRVVRYVRRTGEDVVIGNASEDERFAADEYVQRSGAKSILCVPVSHQGRLSGILYLENTFTADTFTPERLEIMRILAAQAAISLENARLYEEMKAEVGRRSLAEQALRDALAQLEVLKNRLEAENVYLQEEIRTQHNFNEIVGNSAPLLEALRRVERVAPTDSTVLIVGETGTGKELFARAIHSRSARKTRPLVKVNCGAIAPGLVESELFGHVKGAFTGAIDKRVGRFEVANGGTIFLDEVGELSLEAQVKLLRVLQEHEFEPVGSSRTIRVDVRVIAATNRNLDEAVKGGKFRADLLYRLNVFPVEVPPLRVRRADIPLLVAFFVTGLARKLGKPIHGFSSRSMDRIMSYDWAGNVRELQNVVERAAILAHGPVLELEAEVLPAAQSASPDVPSTTLDEIQRAHIASVLKMTGGVVEGSKGAASILGLHPNTLRSRMKKLGISVPSRRMS